MTTRDSSIEESHRPPAQWYTCSGFQRDLLLGVVTHDRLDESPYGVALQEWLGARYPRDVVRSRVYHNLGELVEAGLLARDGSSAYRTPYRLTDASKQCLATHGQFVNALDLQALVPDTELE
ncbi:helix-turn-helix transcriptional regulator [Haloarcula sp. S1CR25-12]|uniref:Helix-turn-helix transcriptional regulator n=1 Tax=Haloarcula saliterrae TaxID=2950534 RepID=A0ABU2FJ86_9EURY|nr:DNA-binding protein [Haloarcula sp. S1CR25-12]MDS0261895.1 helix-turn-helix transcriptional regulator [Haloarcula sp. S1CR25-12]